MLGIEGQILASVIKEKLLNIFFATDRRPRKNELLPILWSGSLSVGKLLRSFLLSCHTIVGRWHKPQWRD